MTSTQLKILLLTYALERKRTYIRFTDENEKHYLDVVYVVYPYELKQLEIK